MRVQLFTRCLIEHSSGSSDTQGKIEQFWSLCGLGQVQEAIKHQITVNLILTLKFDRQQGENWLKCDDDDVRISYYLKKNLIAIKKTD